MVITTRNRAFLLAYQPLDVGVFTPEQAAAFLHRRTGLNDPDGAAELAEELGHLPLALAQAAAVIARLRLDYGAYLHLLRGFPAGDYLPAHEGDAYPVGTAEAILLSVTQAEAALPFAGQLLPILAMLSPAGIPLAVFGGTDGDPGLREMLADLADTSLITLTEDGSTVVMHRLVQRMLRDRAAYHGDLDAVIDQAIDLLSAFNATLPNGARTWAARAAVETLIDQADALYRHISSDDDLPADLLTLRAWCGRYLTNLADLSRAIPLLEATLVDFERVLGANHPDTLTSRNNLAHAYQAAGDLSRAIPLYEATLADSERVLGADHPMTRTVRGNLERTAAEKAGRSVRWWERVLPGRGPVGR
ncbi:tetratricopeptide repeat protein [Nonomuraea sp. NPDC003707]